MPDLTPSEVQNLTSNIAYGALRRGLTSRRLATYVGLTNVSDCERYLGVARPGVPLLKSILGPTLVAFVHALGVRPRTDLYILTPAEFAHKYPVGPVPTDQSEIPTPEPTQPCELAPHPTGLAMPPLDWQPADLAAETPTPHEPLSPSVSARPESASPPPATPVNPVTMVNPVPANTLSPMEITALREALPPPAAPPVPRRASRQERLDILDLWQRRRITTRELDYVLGGAAQ